MRTLLHTAHVPPVVAQPQVGNCCKVNLSKNLGEGGRRSAPGISNHLCCLTTKQQKRKKRRRKQKTYFDEKTFWRTVAIIDSALRHMHKSEINSWLQITSLSHSSLFFFFFWPCSEKILFFCLFVLLSGRNINHPKNNIKFKLLFYVWSCEFP